MSKAQHNVLLVVERHKCFSLFQIIMPRNCCVAGCHNNAKVHRHRRFHKMSWQIRPQPTTTDHTAYRKNYKTKFEKWIEAINREDWKDKEKWPDERIRKQYVCSDHFVMGK